MGTWAQGKAFPAWFEAIERDLRSWVGGFCLEGNSLNHEWVERLDELVTMWGMGQLLPKGGVALYKGGPLSTKVAHSVAKVAHSLTRGA